MNLDEIESFSNFRAGSTSMNRLSPDPYGRWGETERSANKNLAQVKKAARQLPGSPYLYAILPQSGAGKGYYIYILTPEAEIIGGLDVTDHGRMLEVDKIQVLPEYRGQGLGMSLYGIALSILKKPLVAGTAQTPDSQQAWRRLSQMPGVQVMGMLQMRRALVPFYQWKINELGAQPWIRAGNHQLYLFPVTAGKKRMKVAQPKVHKIYGRDNEDLYTTMIAFYNQQPVLESAEPEADVTQEFNKKLAEVMAPNQPVKDPILEALKEMLDEVKIDNRRGAGQVPWNENVDYLGLRVAMTPRIYLRLALPMNNSASDQQTIQDLAAIKDSQGFGAPFMEIMIPNEWFGGDFSMPAKVVGHDGRHRMRAVLDTEGNVPVETHLIPRRGVRNRDLTAEIINHLQQGMISQNGDFVRGPLFTTPTNENLMMIPTAEGAGVPSLEEYGLGGFVEDYDPNDTPPGPEFKPTMPAGTVRVDVSDVYDWYKLGQHISNLQGLGKHDFGQGPPSTIFSFGDEETEHKYIKNLEKTGLKTTDIDPVDPNQPPGMKRQKTDPTYNVDEARRRRKKKNKSAYSGYFFPGYNFFGGDASGDGGGDGGGGGEANNMAENMDHSKDSRAVEELRAAMVARKDQLQAATDDEVYDIIDKIMTRIARSHSITGKKLHDLWVKKYKQIPDTWIMKQEQGVAGGLLSEIYKMPPTKGSSQGLTIWAYNDALEKKSPILYNDNNIIIFKANEDLLRYIILQNGDPVLYIGLSKFLDGYKSGTVATEIAGRGKGLAQQAYLNASDILGVPIYSDTTQTDASRLGIWDKLIQQYPNRIVGYDQKTNKDLPLSMSDKGPIVNQNQPIYVNKKDTTKSIAPNQRYRTRILKLLPKKQGVAEGKVKLYTDPNYFGAEVDDAGFDSLSVVNIPINRLVGFEPDNKMQQPKAMANVKKILAGMKQGGNIPPILVRKYKTGYQVLDGHHRFWAYKVAKKDSIPARVVDPKDIEEIGKPGVAENFADGRKFVEPNFDFEWEEAERYPEFVKLGKDAWIELAQKGKAITINSAHGINNTDAADPGSFKLLHPEKQKRALAQLEKGTVEMPIVAVYSDGHKELIGGNTRLTAMMARDGRATVWAFRVPDNILENFADGKVKGRSRPGRVKRAGASCSGSVTDLRQRAKNASGERARMYHWCANMKSGRQKANESPDTATPVSPQQWIDQVYDMYPQVWQNNHVMPLGGQGQDQQFAMFELVPNPARKNTVDIKWIQAYPLRQGVGSRAMKELQRLAHKDNITLTLYPWDKGQVSQAKLMKFYRQQGFKPTVKGAKNMVWSPDKTLESGLLESWKTFKNSK